MFTSLPFFLGQMFLLVEGIHVAESMQSLAGYFEFEANTELVVCGHVHMNSPAVA
jgi:hypothetical protein